MKRWECAQFRHHSPLLYYWYVGVLTVRVGGCALRAKVYVEEVVWYGTTGRK